MSGRGPVRRAPDVMPALGEISVVIIALCVVVLVGVNFLPESKCETGKYLGDVTEVRVIHIGSFENRKMQIHTDQISVVVFGHGLVRFGERVFEYHCSHKKFPQILVGGSAYDY